MGTVTEWDDCPKCEFAAAQFDYDCHRNEQFILCPKCHWSYSRTRKRDDSGNFIGDGSEQSHYLEEEDHSSRFIWIMTPQQGLEKFLEDPPISEKRGRRIQEIDRSQWDNHIENAFDKRQ